MVRSKGTEMVDRKKRPKLSDMPKLITSTSIIAIVASIEISIIQWFV